MSAPDLPPRPVAERLSAALAPMRARLLRRIGIAHRGPVLDLGAGWGLVTAELARRSRGPVVALDRHPDALAALGPDAVAADAADMPFERDRFDLVFCQQVLMWQPRLEPVLREVRRVLRPGGVLVALEPDYGGMMEHPPEIAVAPTWRDALERAGADPLVGRKRGPALRAAGFDVRVELVPSPAAPDSTRFDALEGLPLRDGETARVERAAAAQGRLEAAACFVHLPFVCAIGGKPG